MLSGARSIQGMRMQLVIDKKNRLSADQCDCRHVATIFSISV